MQATKATRAGSAARILLAVLLAIGMMAPAAVPQRAHAAESEGWTSQRWITE